MAWSFAARWIFALALCALGALLIFPRGIAEAQNAKRWKIGIIHVTGAQRFPEEKIALASGLRSGQTVGAPELDAAVQKLGGTGAFDNVSYRYAIQNGELIVTFEVEEAQRFLQCAFDNFPWFTDEELGRALRDAIPLYDGSVPESGGLADAVAAQLENLLRAKQIQSSVEYIRRGELGGKSWRTVFRVTGVTLPVRRLRFPGATPAMAAQLPDAVRQLFGKNYSREDVWKFAEQALIPLYRQHGFLRAQFSEPKAQLVDPASSEAGVSVTLPVDEGLAYTWAAAEWSGNSVFAASDLNGWLIMTSGELADGLKIDAGLDAVRDAYGSRGYIETEVRAEPTFDDASQKVTFRMHVVEGPQYRMGEFIVQGANDEAVARLEQLWALKPGDVYNASYWKDFTKGSAARVLARAGGAAKGFDFQFHPDRNNRVVKVELEIH